MNIKFLAIEGCQPLEIDRVKPVYAGYNKTHIAVVEKCNTCCQDKPLKIWLIRDRLVLKNVENALQLEIGFNVNGIKRNFTNFEHSE